MFLNKKTLLTRHGPLLELNKCLNYVINQSRFLPPLVVGHVGLQRALPETVCCAVFPAVDENIDLFLTGS